MQDFFPDVVATNRHGLIVYGVALGCSSLEDLDVIKSIQMLANRTQVYMIFPEACGEMARAMKQTVFAHNNINLLFI